MKEIPLPETPEQQEKKKRSLHAQVRLLGTFAVTFAVLAIAVSLGMFIAVIIAEFHRADAVLCYYLAAGFGGGAVIFALLAFLFGKRSGSLQAAVYDFLERCDGEDSFFVGEGTLATFEEGHLRIHGEGSETEIFIPYADIRIFSVCARTLPRERGEWSAVLEIPRRYLMKEKTYSEGDPPALVQTDLKARLLSTLEKYGIELLGEHKPSDMPTGKRFEPIKKYYLPDRKKRSRALLLGGVGLALIAAGILLAFLYNIAAGTMCGVLGAFLLARAAIAFVQARSMLAFYQEGLYWRQSVKRESVFLKWEEVERIERGEHKGMPILNVHCAYGDYHFPAIGDVWDYLKQSFGDKCDA